MQRAEQPAFLRCLFSPISCKRSLSTSEENEKVAKIINKNDLHECLRRHTPLRLCLQQQEQQSFTWTDMNLMF